MEFNMYCKSCGESLITGTKFCGKCGAVAEVTASEGIRCPTCGATNRPGAKFCRQDGTPLVDAPSISQEPKAVPPVAEHVASPEAPIVRPVSHEPRPAAPAPALRPVQAEVAQASGGGGASGLRLAVVALAVLAAAGGGYWFYKSRGASPQAVDAAQAPAAQTPETAVPEPESDVLEVPPAQAQSESPQPVQSQVADAPQVSVGDHWVTEVVDHQDAKLNYRAERVVTDVGNDRIVTSVRTVGKDYVRSVEYSGQWALIATHLPSGATTTYSPALPYLSFPLEQGKSWQASVVETDAEGKQRVHDVKARMESWETVQVPAGTFTALKVVLTDDISRDGVVVQQGQDVSWYAPDVRRTVKTEESSFDPATGERRRRTISLVGYSLHGTANSDSIAEPETAKQPAQSGLAAESVVGVWRFYEHSIERYLRITAAGSGRFKLVEGYGRVYSTGNAVDGAIDWNTSSTNSSDGIDLSEANGELRAAFVSGHFRATHGQDFTYRLTITPKSPTTLTYAVWSSIRGDTDTFEATRVSGL